MSQDGWSSHQELAIRPICYSTREAARALGVSQSSLRRLTKLGDLRYVRLSAGRVGYRHEELERFVKSREV